MDSQLVEHSGVDLVGVGDAEAADVGRDGRHCALVGLKRAHHSAHRVALARAWQPADVHGPAHIIRHTVSYALANVSAWGERAAEVLGLKCEVRTDLPCAPPQESFRMSKSWLNCGSLPAGA